MITHKVTPLLTILISFFIIQSNLAAQEKAATSWNVVEEDGKQYVPVSDIEKFYQFKGGFFITKPPSYRMFHTNLELGFQYESDQILFNKVPIATFEPMVKQKKAILLSVQDLSSIINPVLNPQRIRCKRVSQLILGFGGGGQAEPAFFNSAIKEAQLYRVQKYNPNYGGMTIQINRQAMKENQKAASVVWAYSTDPALVAHNNRNVAMATSISAIFNSFENMEVGKVTAKEMSQAKNDLIINLAVESVDEELIWKAVLKSINKFNGSLGR